jgi:hypothetical protein
MSLGSMARTLPDGLLLLLLLGGCSLALDVNKKQCEAHEDCLTLFDQDVGYSCVQDFCVREACSSDSECAARGDKFAASICGAEQLCQTADCKTDQDCRDRGASFAGNVCIGAVCGPEPTWGCLGEVPTPASGVGPFRVTLNVQDLVSQKPLAGVSARLCRKLDVNCEAPESATVISGDDGVVVFEVPGRFTGYVYFTRDDLSPGLYFFNPPVTADTNIAAVQLVSPIIASLLTSQAGTTQSSDRGLALLSTANCAGRPGEGVQFQSEDKDASSVIFYSANSLPVATATATDADGYGGIINLPPGTAVITGILAADGREVSSISLLMKAGAITYTRLAPPIK